MRQLGKLAPESAPALPAPINASHRSHSRHKRQDFRRGAGQDWIPHSSPTRWPSWQGAFERTFRSTSTMTTAGPRLPREEPIMMHYMSIQSLSAQYFSLLPLTSCRWLCLLRLLAAALQHTQTGDRAWRSLLRTTVLRVHDAALGDAAEHGVQTPAEHLGHVTAVGGRMPTVGEDDLPLHEMSTNSKQTTCSPLHMVCEVHHTKSGYEQLKSRNSPFRPTRS